MKKLTKTIPAFSRPWYNDNQEQVTIKCTCGMAICSRGYAKGLNTCGYCGGKIEIEEIKE